MGHKKFACFILFAGLVGCAHQSQFTYPPQESESPLSSTSYNSQIPPTGQNSRRAETIGTTGTKTKFFKNPAHKNSANGQNTASNASNEEYPSQSTQENEIYGRGINTALDQAIDLCSISQSYREQGNIEKAIQALDQAYGLILEIDEADGGEAIQQKEDLRFTISKRILEIYASRTLSLPGDRKAIPISLNERVMDEIHSFTEGSESDFFISAYTRSGKYRDYIEKALEEAGLPKELSWLPLIESGFKTSALSPARALGLWQFIPSTGYRYGLSRNRYVDERLDFEKSTLAAISYLKDLHDLFGDWETVLAAYNCGEGRVLRTIRAQNINYLDNFWDLYEQLPAETARYVPRFIATLHIVGNLEKYGLTNIEKDPPFTYETIEVAQAVHLRDISASIGVSESSLTGLNPELRYNILPGSPYHLRLPPGYKETLIANIGNIPEYSTPKSTFVFHTVNSGETLASIAEQFQTTPDEILEANDMGDTGHTIVGQRLKIPMSSDNEHSSRIYAMASTSKKSQDIRSGKNDHPKPNDTAIQKRATEVKQRKKDVKESAVVCQKTKQKDDKTITVINSKISKKAPRDYRVRKGDSPFSIANLHNMSLDRLLALNKLRPSTKLQLGQRLLVE